MTIEIGDVVMVGSGLKYVVADFSGNGAGGQYAHLIRKNRDGSYSRFTKDAEYLVPLERPTFEAGDPVTVNGLKGGYLDTENGVSSVRLEERRHDLKSGGFIILDAAVCRLPRFQLVLENRTF